MSNIRETVRKTILEIIEEQDKVWCIDMAYEIQKNTQLYEDIVKRQNNYAEFGNHLIGKVINTSIPCKSIDGDWIWENPLNESSLSRIMQLQSVGFFALSAYRFEDEDGELVDEKINIENDKKLKAEVRSKNLGYIELQGQSEEKHFNKIKQEYEILKVNEKSILIPYTKRCGMNKKEFKKYALKLGKDFKQFTVLYYDPEEDMNTMYLLYPNGQVFKTLVPQFNITKIAKLYSSHLAKGSHGLKAAQKRKALGIDKDKNEKWFQYKD